MKETRSIMGMPFTIELTDSFANQESLEHVFAYLVSVDEQFSTYKPTSEISRINSGELKLEQAGEAMQEVFRIAEETKKITHGYFDISTPDGSIDPSGVVKGWAIHHAALLLTEQGHTDFLLNGSGDMASRGKNSEGKEWSIGIRNPFSYEEIVKVVYPHEKGIATSGTSERGAHIYNPLSPDAVLDEIVSVTVIAKDVLQADLFATAAFAMGRDGLPFIQTQDGFEGYAIDTNGIATMTPGFLTYTTI